jgi:hypothetical protein
MRVVTGRWLARNPTLCFPRQVVAVTEDYASTRRILPWRGYSAAARGLRPSTEIVEEDRVEKRQWTIGRPGTATPDDASETALRLSLNSGVPLFEPSTQPGEALRALRRQADVASGHTLGELAVDRPENRGNLALWAELLQYRQRVDGFEGVLDVWRGMRRRDVDLPIRGNEAEIMWTIFIHAGIRSPHDERHDRLLHNVVDHARDLYARAGVYDGLHRCIVGRWVRIKPSVARNWHKVLCKDFGNPQIQWPALASDFAHAREWFEARKTFRAICNSTQQRGLYGYYIPQVLKQQGDEEALRWHRLFLKRGDAPDAETFADPAIQRLFEMDGNASLPVVHNKQDHATKPLDISYTQAQFPPLTRATMSTLVGDVHGIKPKEVSDSFVAKMFATYAFSLDLVVTGLGFFGVDNLGPLAVREMALKAGTFAVFSNKLGDLKACGIGVQQSVYGRLVHKITVQGSAQLFDTLIASDQHPESYEDASTQELLLASFLENEDLINAHITLMGLSLAAPRAHERAWNRLLQRYIKKRDYRSISRTTEQMQASGMNLSKRTLTFMHRHVLPVRRPSKGPLPLPPGALVLNPLQFTTNAYIYAATKGVQVHPALWIENLKRYGMMHKWDELERLVLWLAHWYSTHSTQPRYTSAGRWQRDPGILQTIFSRQMREAIVTWGFRHASQDRLLRAPRDGEDSPPCEPWARGLALVDKIRRYGILTTPETARKAFLLRMWVLFGPAYSTKAVNVEAKRNNQLTLAHYVRHANEVWNGKLFPKLDHRLTDNDPSNHPKLLIALFGQRHRVNKQRQEHADVYAYAQVLAHRRASSLPSRRNGLARRKLWRYSPFRILQSTRPTHGVQLRRERQYIND